MGGVLLGDYGTHTHAVRSVTMIPGPLLYCSLSPLYISVLVHTCYVQSRSWFILVSPLCTP